MHDLGIIVQAQGNNEEAQWLFRESLEIKERLGHRRGRANALHNLGNIALLQKDNEEARRLYQEGLKIYELLGDQNGRAASLVGQLLIE